MLLFASWQEPRLGCEALEHAPFDIVTPERVYTLVPLSPPEDGGNDNDDDDGDERNPHRHGREGGVLVGDGASADAADSIIEWRNNGEGEGREEGCGTGGGTGGGRGAAWRDSSYVSSAGGVSGQAVCDADGDYYEPAMTYSHTAGGMDSSGGSSGNGSGGGPSSSSWLLFANCAPQQQQQPPTPPPPPPPPPAPWPKPFGTSAYGTGDGDGSSSSSSRSRRRQRARKQFELENPTLCAKDFDVCIVDSLFPSREAGSTVARLLLKRDVNDLGVPWEFECPLTLEVGVCAGLCVCCVVVVVVAELHTIKL